MTCTRRCRICSSRRREIHGRATLLQKAGEFPAPLEHEYPIGDDAGRYYKSGKGFLYRHLPFWVASLLDRTMVLLIPIVVLLIPGLRIVPTMYSWRVRSRIYRRYGELMALEREMLVPVTAERREELQRRLASTRRPDQCRSRRIRQRALRVSRAHRLCARRLND
jgi:hypothetical protein